jgi:small subunit ribosomal protein S5
MDKNIKQLQYEQRNQDGFEEKIVQVSRVSKKTQGGNKIGFSVLMVAGNKSGKVGVGLGKAGDVSSAIRKGASLARKHAIEVPIINGTIPFEFYIKLGAAKVLLKPAPKGSGVIAGGAVRSVVSLAGIQNISSKVLGTDNQASNVYATIEALDRLATRYKRENDLRKAKHEAK